MIKTFIQKFATSMALAVMLLTPSVATVHAAVSSTPDIDGSLCKGANLSVNSTETCNTTANGTKVDKMIASVINIFSVVVGVVSVIMIIIGGFKYITSGGDSGNITGAKNTILYAIIGLVIVALAQVVVKFVLEKTATVG